MNDLQQRVLVEAETYFYVAGYPEMFSLPENITDSVRATPVAELRRINAEVRSRLRGGPLGSRPRLAIKPAAATTPEGLQADGAR